MRYLAGTYHLSALWQTYLARTLVIPLLRDHLLPQANLNNELA